MALNQQNAIFLTTKPLARRLSQAQREWLYIEPLVDKVAAKLNITLLYTDATTHNYQLPIGDLRQYETVIVPVDFTSRGYNAINPAKTIATITIAMFTNPEDVVVYQHWDPATDNILEFHYFNSLGGIDTFVATGDPAESTSFSRLIGKRFTPEGYLASSGAFFVENQRSRDALIVYTGYKPVGEIQATIDMLHTNKIYRLLTIDGIAVQLPYIFEGETVEYPSANTNLKAIAFTLRSGWDLKARNRVT